MGRPPKARALKVLSGTVQPCRDVDETLPLPVATALPPAPEWLPNSHALVEYRRLGKVMLVAGLLHAGNVGTLALLAATHGLIVQAIAAGEFPWPALIAQYRGLASDLGLTGMVRVPKAQRVVNPFFAHKPRPSIAGGK